MAYTRSQVGAKLFDPYLPQVIFLFKYDASTKKVLRRKNIMDLLCKDYIDNWWGLTTLLELYWYHKDNGDTFLTQSEIQTMYVVLKKHGLNVFTDKNTNSKHS